MSTQIELAADYEAARQIGPWLADALSELRAAQASRAGEVELALHELAINIVDHAYDDATRKTPALVFAFNREERRRAYIHQAFDRYLSPALVRQIADNPDKLELGGEEREMTVLFCATVSDDAPLMVAPDIG